ncbi:hypothetical protein [Bacillus alveayuensis]|uniref:hypothetical protein n=1 Tax=Aeribacillus alveayuensis TaxID=279215 RepID=UPI0005CCACB3|nr:hypothetical protein [Bacillus alveayuensis]
MVVTKRMLIAPCDIKTWYYDEVSMQTAYKRLNALKKLGYDLCLLVVGKIGVQKYVLLEGYQGAVFLGPAVFVLSFQRPGI